MEATSAGVEMGLPSFCIMKLVQKKWSSWVTILSVFLLSGGSLFAQEEPSPIDSGDTAWMLTATVLVLLMTLPGLALFYGGLVRSKNVLSILVQCFCGADEVLGDADFFGDLDGAFLSTSVAPGLGRWDASRVGCAGFRRGQCGPH